MRIFVFLLTLVSSLYGLSHPCDELDKAVRLGQTDDIRVFFPQCRFSTEYHVRGWTALHEATINRQLESMKLLIELGMDKDIADGNGWTPMHVAIYRDFTAGIEFLLKNTKPELRGCNDGNQ